MSYQSDRDNFIVQASRDDHREPTWKNQLWHARGMKSADLKPHAAVSTDNLHRCRDCFCCAALTVLEEREEERQ